MLTRKMHMILLDKSTLFWSTSILHLNKIVLNNDAINLQKICLQARFCCSDNSSLPTEVQYSWLEIESLTRFVYFCWWRDLELEWRSTIWNIILPNSSNLLFGAQNIPNLCGQLWCLFAESNQIEDSLPGIIGNLSCFVLQYNRFYGRASNIISEL